MSPEFYRYAVWSGLILTAATAAILWQHAQHTSYILGQLPTSPGAPSMAGADSSPLASGSPTALDDYAIANAANTVSSNPGWSGAFSRASGQWSPLGPTGQSIMGYNPGQTFQ